MTKIYISMPMAGMSISDILRKRADHAKNAAKIAGLYDAETVIVDSLVPDADKLDPLVCLARSIEAMATANIVYFAAGWDSARGCRIEHECAVAYGKTVIEET